MERLPSTWATVAHSNLCVLFNHHSFSRVSFLGGLIPLKFTIPVLCLALSSILLAMLNGGGLARHLLLGVMGDNWHIVFKIAPENKNISFVFSELDKMLIGKDVMLALAKKRDINSFTFKVDDNFLY